MHPGYLRHVLHHKNWNDQADGFKLVVNYLDVRFNIVTSCQSSNT